MKKSVIITGAGSGIGQAVALEFAKNGYFCWLVGKTLSKLEKTQSLVPDSKILVFDFEKIDLIQQFFQEKLAADSANIEILVNNAGFFERAIFQESPLSHWQKMLNVNLLAPVELTKVIFPWMKKSKRGSIVNISSTLGLKPAPTTSAYSASKAALVNWTVSLAQEGGPDQIRANCVCPGIVDTPIHDFNSLAPDLKAIVLDNMKSLQPLQRIGTTEEIAKSVYFLGSPESSWTTGAILSVDGGIYIK